MLKDSFQKIEFRKYGNILPTRDLIINYLKKRRKPARGYDLAKKFDIHQKDKLEALYSLLYAMEIDGQLVSNSRHYYSVIDTPNLIKGQVIGHKDGYGFLKVEGSKYDFYLSVEQMKKCIQGDVIIAKQLTNSSRKGRYEARVIRVIQPRKNKIIGRYFIISGTGFVVPGDSRINFDILIPIEYSMNVSTGFMVVVELIKRPYKNINAMGRIIEILGDHMNSNLAVDMALRMHEIPYIWSAEVKEQVLSFDKNLLDRDKQGRIDLRKLPFVTIDGDDAHDFDDALYCKKADGRWYLWVAIADVSHYVHANTPIDKEAQKRGTSVYFPMQVIPMLPEILSNDLCSLNPHVDRLCLVCEMSISQNGKLINYHHYEAVINSHARFTYNEVSDILQGKKKPLLVHLQFIKHLKALYAISKLLEKERKTRGGIFFKSEEPKFIFTHDHRIQRIECIEYNEAQKLVEECMILANVATADFVEKNNKPMLFRDHDSPSEERVATFRTVLNKLGLRLSGGSKPKPINYTELLQFINNRPDEEMLQSILLRSMKQAVYDAENRGHFGLALTSYTHFTSPIRRYPDLILHRIIKYLLNISNKAKSNNINSGAYYYEITQILQLGKHCSMTERRADEATRDVIDWLKCDFMQKHIGHIFNGVISNVQGMGFFVRLNNLFIDGLVHLSTLKKDYYFDPLEQSLVSNSGSKTYSMGDHVKVIVKSVHIEERKILFILASQVNNLCIKTKKISNNKNALLFKQNHKLNQYNQCK
ncbi:ribonuclease R [Candidatus Ishikawella capsulata]|uniref:Ribonuclease R n=1 Tax=Candidatus Ishikawaella capsulata Mpkobe TaxID=476281 RepID=C5WCH9_9ENTR|nr:ribonuclease R [Candidatus Ishikawaella capsulata]BAH83035.1 exoribonuclease R [Candidatus Ishikawaella capsulata Mpkobe]